MPSPTGGTIFLDEIGDIPPELQLRLLRVLQEHEFEPVGSAKTLKVDVRVIAATNRDLKRALAEGSFRADLFYRLNIFPVHVPPLRERREDIPLLVPYFLRKAAMKVGRSVESASDATMRQFMHYAWPGNIRELENVIERALILSTGATLELGPHLLQPSENETALPPPPSAPSAEAAGNAISNGLTLEDTQRRHILLTLHQCNWVIEGPRGAAKFLGLNPNTLRSRMKKLAIRRTQ